MAVMWSDLSADDQAGLLSAPDLEVTAGCELLNFDLSLADATLTDDFEAASGDDIVWTGNSTVHRDCQITLSRRLDWGNALVRIYRTYTDPLSRLTARANRGVFVLMAPDTHVAETPQSWEVQGQDRLYLLNRQVGYSYVIASGTNVLSALAQVFADAGLTGVLIDSSRSAATLPSAMTWPLIQTTTDTSTTSDAAPAPPPDSGQGDTTSGSGPATWQQIVNDLLGLINYRAVWCDENGYYICQPYVVPSGRLATFTFDGESQTLSNVAVDRTESGNNYARDTPNLYIFQWSNIPDVSDGAGGTIPATPVEGNGIYTRVVSTGPTSAGARNGTVWPTQIALTAASQADLVAQAEAKVAADLQRAVTLTCKTVPYPASHFDRFTLTDAALDGSPWQVEAMAWTEHLDGSDTEWTLTKVG
jgi:hypothetical protein